MAETEATEGDGVMDKWYFRLRWKVLGGHVHCRLFSTKNYNGTWAKCGDIIVSVEEWPQFQEALAGRVELKEEGK